ncbi:MAG: hypothetical protein FJY99_01550 [Candidatus Sericytochromatia bacterium]|nr:hypothetical protein [Candidatus Tanganyikabacteria bacterium]
MRQPLATLLALGMLVSGTLPARAAEDSPMATRPQQGPDAIARTLQRLGYKYRQDEDGDYTLIFETENKRSQMVWINGTTETYGPYDIIEIWSPAYRFKGTLDKAESYLEASQAKKLGAWQIARNPDGEGILMFVAKLTAPATEAGLDAAIHLVIDVADRMEAQLTDGGDAL